MRNLSFTRIKQRREMGHQQRGTRRGRRQKKGAGTMAQRVEVPAIMAADKVTGPSWWEERTSLQKLSSDSFYTST